MGPGLALASPLPARGLNLWGAGIADPGPGTSLGARLLLNT